MCVNDKYFCMLNLFFEFGCRNIFLNLNYKFKFRVVNNDELLNYTLNYLMKYVE